MHTPTVAVNTSQCNTLSTVSFPLAHVKKALRSSFSAATGLEIRALPDAAGTERREVNMSGGSHQSHGRTAAPQLCETVPPLKSSPSSDCNLRTTMLEWRKLAYYAWLQCFNEMIGTQRLAKGNAKGWISAEGYVVACVFHEASVQGIHNEIS